MLLADLAVIGHGSVVQPTPRNAIDADLEPWSQPVPVTPDGRVAFEPWCPVPSADGPSTPAGRLTGRNGQACFWFSAGCSIGCPNCDGVTRGPIPNQPCKTSSPAEMCRRIA